MNEITYSNWYTKLLLARSFERQHFIPIPRNPIEKWIFKTIEAIKFRGSFDQIKIEKPIFIVGLPRSGTTLLYNLLCAHKQSAYITNVMNSYPESPCTIEWLRKKFSLNIEGERFFKDSISTDFSSPSEPIMFWGKWFGRDTESLEWPTITKADLSSNKLSEIYRDLKKIVSCFGPGPDRRFVCKYPVAQTELRLIQELFPDVRFIHIIRDGRAVANSLLKLNRISNEQLKKIRHPTVESIITYPRIKNLQKYVQKYGPDDIRTTSLVWQESIDLVNETRGDLNHFCQIKYEDLLEDPKQELKRIFDFCDLEAPGSRNQRFNQEFSKIGKTTHTNNYSEFDVVEKLAHRALKEYSYL